jgi:hypothetical protein
VRAGFLREDVSYFGSEAVSVSAGVWGAENGLALTDEPEAVGDFSFATLRKKRQSQWSQRNGRTDSLAKNASKNPLFLDLRVWSL